MMALQEAMTMHDSLGALVRTHREALGLTQLALARACELSPVYISQIEKGERIPSVAACRALAQALGCAPRLLVLRAFRATAPVEIQDLLRDEGVVASDDPLWQELTPLVATVRTLPQGTRQQLVQLWQATLQLVQGGSPPPPNPPVEPVSEALEPYTATPYY
jgi:transcriptional regulator with XRE-family HTH domain